MMEISPTESVKNNVFGTANVIEQCHESKVLNFVLISTDKAVNPANVMGASKRIAEMLVQTKSETCFTQLAAVRFGNVLGSNGSVVGIFLEQIKNGGPISLTHRDIKRYFMTIPEAVRLVLQAGALASRGEVFVLDMGEPVLIYDLAVDLIKMHGLVPEQDVAIEVTGLRAGEKLFEELKFDSEVCDKTMHSGIFACRLDTIDKKKFEESLKKLQKSADAENDVQMLKDIFEIVPSIYRRNDN
jgi:FlaA1/EpsC-like NDP-sugar epimerase